MAKVFIVGEQGTTGLRLKDRLSSRDDVTLLEIEDSLRKDKTEIRRIMEKSDFVFLCLPDDSAREMVSLAEGLNVKILDTSTAHRTNDDWAYGFPELSAEHREKIKHSSKVAVPGCHASGFLALIYPLISAGLIEADCTLSCSSLTGYSGGGKKMIAEYEGDNTPSSPLLYGMAQAHKHLPEMEKHCSLKSPPVFLPIVGNYYSGMLVSVPIDAKMLTKKLDTETLRSVYINHYKASELVTVSDDVPESLYAENLSGRDDMQIYITGSNDRFLVNALFDNLGKGASGAAIQCFNIMCSLNEKIGLVGG